MKTYIFSDPEHLAQLHIDHDRILDILNCVSGSTDTASLINAVYLIPGIHQTRGVYIRRWSDPGHFQTGRGNWKFTGVFPAPNGLPAQFRLIRMRLDTRNRYFPREERDSYGWHFTYKRPEDQLALLFAHELHHYRRYHLELHPGEGEHRANQWALNHIQGLGFQVTGYPVKRKRHKKRPFNLFHGRDPFTAFRSLKSGDRIDIRHDPRDVYTGQTALVIRPLRNNAKRLVIRTSDGKEWRWPVSWLTPPSGS
ncbi:hypothetical protein JW948_12590 [bacterium]|nr:hypothetical protein [bacterium]